jgi:hypothetical protein
MFQSDMAKEIAAEFILVSLKNTFDHDLLSGP